MQGVGTQEMIHFLRRLGAWYMCHPTISVFIHSLDFKKAFDSVHTHLMEDVLDAWGIPPKLKALLLRLDECRFVVLGLNGT